MSSQAEHSKQAVHNQNFFNSINSNVFPDWAVISLFYKSVHLIESVLAKKNIHPRSHSDRSDCISDDLKLFSNEVRINYNQLKNLSHQARYKPDYPITEENLKVAQECIDIIDSWYKKVI